MMMATLPNGVLPGRPQALLCRLTRLLTVVAGLIVAAGCADDPVALLPGDISGTVRVDGVPLANVAVSVTGPVTKNGMTDEAGQFSFPDLSAGTYTVTVTNPDELQYEFSVTSETVDVTAGATATVSFAGTFKASVSSIDVIDAGSILKTLSITLDRPSSVVVEYWTEGADRLRVTSDANETSHDVFVPRLRSASVYDYEVTTVSSLGGFGAIFPGTFDTEALPSYLSDLRFQVIGEATFPLLMLSYKSVMIDTDGNIVWYRVDGKGTAGFARFPDGDFVFQTNQGLEVVTPMSEVVATLTEDDAAARTGRTGFNMHHDVTVTPDETVLVLVRAGTATVRDTAWVGDEIWEWDPVSDDLTLRWAASDFFSPDTDRGAGSRPDDWIHANSLSIGPRGNYLVSFFFLSEVTSIAADFQSIEWRLGGPASSFTVAEDAMEAGQHTAVEVSPNRVLLFDNGLGRASGELFSRGLELELDQAAGTAETVWEFRPRPDIYAPIVSSARRLANGNTVVGFGPSPGLRDASGPIATYEVTRGNRVLWQVVVEASTRRIYRSTPLYQIAGEEVVPTQLSAQAVAGGGG